MIDSPLVKKTIFSGIQPSAHLTLGNYLGALKHFPPLQKENDCLFFIGDLHTFTSGVVSKDLNDYVTETLATYLAVGIDPQKSLLFLQSHVGAHTQLAWILNCFTSLGELQRMTQFKTKSQKIGKEKVGLLNYPLLMASDILLYQPHFVPVGEDQKQHLELTRDLAIRMNHVCQKEVFRVPEMLVTHTGSRIMSLSHPLEKMSKSDPQPLATIYLTDSEEMIVKKCQKAVTDSFQTFCYSETQKGLKNLIDIFSSVQNLPQAQVVALYEGKSYGVFKKDLADVLISVLSPLRKKMSEYKEKKEELSEILEKGARAANERAQVTLEMVCDCLHMSSRLKKKKK